jgi:hypothetical protein
MLWAASQGLAAHDCRLFLDEGKHAFRGAVSQAATFGKRVVTGHVPFQHVVDFVVLAVEPEHFVVGNIERRALS